MQVSISRKSCMSGAITCSRLGWRSSRRSSLHPTTITGTLICEPTQKINSNTYLQQKVSKNKSCTDLQPPKLRQPVARETFKRLWSVAGVSQNYRVCFLTLHLRLHLILRPANFLKYYYYHFRNLSLPILNPNLSIFKLHAQLLVIPARALRYTIETSPYFVRSKPRRLERLKSVPHCMREKHYRAARINSSVFQ